MGMGGSPLRAHAIYNFIMTKFDPKKHHRRSIRLKGYDYSQEGAYYVTIVTWHREFLFGEIVNKEMRLNKVGKLVEWEWLELPKRLRYVELGTSVVMPNHFHGILFIHENVGATRQGRTIPLSGTEPLQTFTTDGIDGSPLPRGPKPASLGAIIAQFKSRVTKRIWKFPEFKETPIWQRNYYEHIIRDETDLQNKTDYIESNPLLWDEDDENPANIK
jgi:REP element-mobilizing transposase RayT